jgi:pyridoxine kinase
MKGSALTGEDLHALAIGLGQNDLLQYDYLLTGYIGTESFLVSVLELLSDIQRAHPAAKYICDPVLGDDGKYYVPVELVDIYRNKVLPRAYMVTPNQFEAELISGVTIRTEADAIAAITALMALGPKVVILTSAELDAEAGKLCCYAGRLLQGGDGACEMELHRVVVDKQQAHFTGTGDCTAALLLAWTHLLTEGGLGAALINSISTIQSIIKLIAKKQAAVLRAIAPADDPRDGRLMRAVEFNVVQGRRYIVVPPTEGFNLTTWTVPLHSFTPPSAL